MEVVAFLITFLFGIFLMYVGFLMFVKPYKVRELIGKAGSTHKINFLELIPRLIIGISLIIVETKFELIYNYSGFFLVFSAIIIMLLPLKMHNGFSKKAADFLKPIYLKFIAPISVFIGILVIYGII